MPAPDDRDPLERARDLKPREVAADLRISLDTLYALVEEGEFPGVYRIGGRRELRFPPDALRAFKERNRVQT